MNEESMREAAAKVCDEHRINWRPGSWNAPMQLLATAKAAALLSRLSDRDELLSPDGHSFDRRALQSALNDPEVKQWLESVGPLAPVNRRKP